MTLQSKEAMRMELQIEQLIRIVASLNERIIQLEDESHHKKVFFIKSGPDWEEDERIPKLI
ncbi:hypothetical protein [Sporosarcina sp. G11-34]|uniref:hypothetical protein n=1 Tax=Sporosarcina sp. G11-34 TaxID=2849605 RepID=UPI0022A906DF|nr:hypothetical protein [Sporosarcina sp. G11-34]MCZ2257556.1 hypothetical protein [Sporosarcina sp. G11-34]